MTRSRLVFFAIIGAALIIVLGLTVLAPALNICVGSQTANCDATATSRSINSNSTAVSVAATATVQTARANTITLNVIYGSEKQAWFTDAIGRFEQANPGIIINATVVGSVQGYNELSQLTDTATKLDSNGDPIPSMWSPASQIEVNLVNGNSQLGRPVAIQCKQLVISPVVLISWSERAKAFADFYKDKGGLTLPNLEDALDPQGKVGGKWSGLNANPNWGFIKFGHTDPTQSNSGLMTLVLLANNFYGKAGAVSSADISDSKFTDWLTVFEKANTVQTNTQASLSTAYLVNDVIVKGPSQYDFIMAYESLAITNFKNAQGRQGQTLTITYPPFELQSDHPMCIVDHPSITAAQRDAAKKFQDFLLSGDIQRLALQYGFRPADPGIPLFGANTAFDDSAMIASGLGADVKNGGTVQAIQPPDGPTLQNLMVLWKRVTGS